MGDRSANSPSIAQSRRRFRRRSCCCRVAASGSRGRAVSSRPDVRAVGGAGGTVYSEGAIDARSKATATRGQTRHGDPSGDVSRRFDGAPVRVSRLHLRDALCLYAIGTSDYVVPGASNSRDLVIQTWYPAAAGITGASVGITSRPALLAAAYASFTGLPAPLFDNLRL